MERERGINGILIGRPIPSEPMSSELKTAQQDLAVSRMYSMIDKNIHLRVGTNTSLEKRKTKTLDTRPRSKTLWSGLQPRQPQSNARLNPIVAARISLIENYDRSNIIFHLHSF